jgi:hypothetical protein
MIEHSFRELRTIIDKILREMDSCTPDQLGAIEPSIRAAHAWIMHHDEPRQVLERIGRMATFAAMQLRVNTIEGD